MISIKNNSQNLLLLFFQAIIYSGTIFFNLIVIKTLYPSDLQIMIIVLAIIYGVSLVSRNGWEIILVRYLPNFIKKKDLYNYKLIKKKSVLKTLKNSLLSIITLVIVLYAAKIFFNFTLFNHFVNFFYVCILIFSSSLHFIFKSIIQSHKKIKISLISEMGFMHLASASILLVIFYLNIQINITLVIKAMVISSILLNLINYIIILYLENIFLKKIDHSKKIVEINYEKIIPSYFLNMLANYIFEWGVFMVFFVLNLKYLIDFFFSALQVKSFIVFFFVAFARKYSHEFSVNIKEKKISELEKYIHRFNSNVFFYTIITLIVFIYFNKEITSLMYKSQFVGINLMCVTFVIFEFIYLLFGCPQTIGMLSKHHKIFSRINFIFSIFYLFSQFVFIYLFGIWGAIFTFGFFYIGKNITSLIFVNKKLKITTANNLISYVFRKFKFFIN